MRKISTIQIENKIINDDDFHFHFDVEYSILYNYDSLSEENKKIADAYLGQGASHIAPLIFVLYNEFCYFIICLNNNGYNKKKKIISIKYSIKIL